MMTIQDHIKQAKFFKGISAKNILELSRICIARSVGKKELLFTEGQRGFALYLCVSGDIQLFKSSADGKEVVIKVIKAGEVFGEVILFEEDFYPVSAMALTKSLVYLLPKEKFKLLLDRTDFRDDFIVMLMKKQRYLAEQIKYMTIYDVQERFLRFVQDQYGNQDSVLVRMSKKDIAAAIGTTPETLSRVLLRLKEDQVLQWDKNVLKRKAPSDKNKTIT